MRMPRMRVTVRRMLLVVAAFALFFGAIRLLHDGYYEERIRILRQLEDVDGIANIEVSGFDDITYEVLAAQFEIAGREDAVIVIDEPDDGVVGDLEHLRIRRLGPWEFHQYSYGYLGAYSIITGKPVKSLGYNASIDIKSLGELEAKLPVKIRDVNDIVAHYDELVRFFATWPDETRWGILDMPSGTRLAYCRVAVSRSGPIPYPPQFPKAWLP